MLYRIAVLLMFVAVSAPASVREFEGIDWQVEAEKYRVTLGWKPDMATEVAFVKNAGKELALELYAPHITRRLDSARLYSVSSPLQGESNRLLLEQLSGAQVGEKLIFDQQADVLMDAMGKGGWGLLELTGRNGIHYSIELPAIDFSRPLQSFIAQKSTLPELNLQGVNVFSLYFELGDNGLSDANRKQLDRLIEFVQYDGEITAFSIDGHTDSSGSRLKNLTLSRERAEAVEDYLEAVKVSEVQISAVRYHGQRYPIFGEAPAKNRRVDITLSREEIREKSSEKTGAEDEQNRNNEVGLLDNNSQPSEKN